MSLSKKVMITVIAATVCLTGVLSLLAWIIVLGGFGSLEEQETERNVLRAADALTAEERHLDAITSDWSNWDDTYDFVQSGDPDYLASNVTLSALLDLGINDMLFVDKAGAIVSGRSADLATAQEVAVAESWQARFAEGDDGLLQAAAADDGITGIVMSPEGPLLVSARPILTTQGTGPSRGTVVFARNLDGEMVRQIAETTHLSLEVFLLDDPSLPADIRSTLPTLSESAPIAVRPLSGASVAGYTLLSDAFGSPALVLRMNQPRSIYQEGRTSLLYLILALLISGGAFGGVTLLNLQRWVLLPVARLKNGVEQTTAGHLDHRIGMPRGDEIGQVAAAFDEMTARLQRREEELRLQAMALQSYATRLEKSNRDLQDFAFVASHDLQEPLRKVQAFSELLREDYGAALDETAQDYLNRMQSAATRMQSLIEGLLSYSRVTTKAQPFVRVDLDQVAREVVGDLEVRIAETGASVELEHLPMIDADPLQMRQLFQNLLGNALKFHRPGVAPVIKVSGCRRNGHQPEHDRPVPMAHTCEIRVEDNGVGFDEKYTERIFQIFQRLHGRGTYEGTGIGLAVCRKIAERHGGSITAHSVPGSGSAFVVALPECQVKDGEHGER